MICEGSCNCGQWRVKINVTKPLEDLNPRICDCNYCQNNPSAIVSDPGMTIDLAGGTFMVNQNGDRLASFFHCGYCGDFLAVGCNLNGEFRDAVNCSLLSEAIKFGEPIQIQPRLLKASEKLERWGRLWGVLNGVEI